eukprot:5141506-Karenia_brevis.AAC.1
MREEIIFLNAWSADMIKALEENPSILNPMHREHCIDALFKTKTQKHYTGLHDILCILPQSWAPLLVWFLRVFLKQMKVQQLKD